MSLRPTDTLALFVIVGFLGGVLARSFFIVDIFTGAAVTLSATALLALGFMRHSRILLLFALCAFASVLGGLRLDASERYLAQTPLIPFENTTHVITGIMIAAPDARETATNLVIDVASIDGNDSSGRIRVSTERGSEVHYGDEVRVIGMLKKPEPFETDGARIFDYPHYLAKDGITHAISFAKVQLISEGHGNLLVAGLIGIKDAFSRGIDNALVHPESALAAGLVLGEKRGLGDELSDVFRIAGIIHIIVLSGYNIALIAKAAASFFGWFSFGRRVQFVMSILAIVALVIATGATAAAVRAALMGILVITAHMLRRSADAMRLLIAAGVGMVLWNPYVLVFDPGFQLSFLATAGLIALSSHVAERLKFVTERWGLREIAAATIATQIAVLPALLSFSGELSLISVPVNLFVLPVIAPAMALAGFAGAVGIFLPSIAGYVGLLPFFPLWYVIELARLAATLPFASIIVPPLPISVTVAMYVGIAFLIVRSLKTPATAGAKI